jgi:hypothetical protein
MKRRLAAFAGALAVLLAGPALPGAWADVSPEQLGGRIDRLVADIRRSQDAKGAFGMQESQSWPVGQTALGVLGLRAAGIPPDDPTMTKAVEFLLSERTGDARGVYETSLKVMALESVDAKRYQDEIAAGARYLMRAQQGSGGWSYTAGGRTDNSNSQFALLGLNAAAQAGVEVPSAVWRGARDYFLRGQVADGGWGYQISAAQSYGSMTAAGVASLFICDMWLHVQGGRCGVYVDDRPVERGLVWLAQRFSVTRNPDYGRWKFYYLYALERVGVILAQRNFGRHDWYREGVEHLVGDPEQVVMVLSEGETAYLAKCYTLLFLAKGNAPLVMHKARWLGTWNANRYDARFLVQSLGRQLDQQIDWQILPLDAPLEYLMAAPILYISGGSVPQWTPQEVQRLKDYVDAGGFVLVEAANGDRAFDRAFRDLLKREFPDEQLEALPRDHAIYTIQYDIPPADRAPLEALQGPCWVSLLYAPQGLSCPWDVADFKHPHFKLGANIVAYATGLQKLEGKLSKPTYHLPTDRPEGAEQRGAFTMGQIVHGSDWQPHKRAWPKVLEQANEKAGLAVYSRPLPIRLGVDSPFQGQMLYLTGTQEVTLSPEAVQALRLYLERGGFLFAEAACGSKRFDESFRALVAQAFPDKELRMLPLGHPLYQGGEPMGEVKYSAAVKRAAPDLVRPVLEFIEQDGRAVLIYAKYDISSAIDGHPCFNCPSVLEPSAGRLALKIVLYGLSS